MSHPCHARMGDVVDGQFGREASDLAEKIIDRIYDMPVGGLLSMLAGSFLANEVDGLVDAQRDWAAEEAERARENAAEDDAFDRGWDRAGDELAAERGAA